MNAGSSDERLNGRSSKNDHARTTGAQEAGLKNVEIGLGVIGKISDGSCPRLRLYADFAEVVESR